jgi:hypothetical protein
MKKWINKFKNQVLVFSLILITLPLFLIGMCTFETSIITILLWIIGIIVVTFLWKKTISKV